MHGVCMLVAHIRYHACLQVVCMLMASLGLTLPPSPHTQRLHMRTTRACKHACMHMVRVQVASSGLTVPPTRLHASLTSGLPEEPEDEGEREVQLLWGGDKGGMGLQEGPLPPPLPRPPGPLALLGPRGGVLWVINVHGQVRDCRGAGVERARQCVCVCALVCLRGRATCSGVCVTACTL